MAGRPDGTSCRKDRVCAERDGSQAGESGRVRGEHAGHAGGPWKAVSGLQLVKEGDALHPAGG